MLKPIISASILSADFAHLADDVNAVLDAGVHHIHFDVMDHHYVPNLTFGADICSALRRAQITAPIDVHLMVEHPEKHIEAYAKAGANWITFHPSTTDSVSKTIDIIEAAGMHAGLAFNPDEDVTIDDETLKRLKTILLMSVFPGFGGQSFIETTFAKISALRKRIDTLQHPLYIGVDGGIKIDNIGAIKKAGANFFVIGSGLFNHKNYKECLQQLMLAIK